MIMIIILILIIIILMKIIMIVIIKKLKIILYFKKGKSTYKKQINALICCFDGKFLEIAEILYLYKYFHKKN